MYSITYLFSLGRELSLIMIVLVCSGCCRPLMSVDLSQRGGGKEPVSYFAFVSFDLG